MANSSELELLQAGYEHLDLRRPAHARISIVTGAPGSAASQAGARAHLVPQRGQQRARLARGLVVQRRQRLRARAPQPRAWRQRNPAGVQARAARAIMLQACRAQAGCLC
jgi:hypothetical protein